MDIITVLSLVAATITITTFIFLIYKRVRKFMVALDDRLNAVEDSFKVREELYLERDIVVENKINNRLYTIPANTVVTVLQIDGDMIEFVTDDKLITARVNINNFIQRNN